MTALRIQVLPHGRGLELPAYQTPGSAGMDVRAAVSEDLLLRPGERAAVPTGLVFAVPQGYEAQVRPRSGLALKRGIAIPNAPGTIDSDYRGEVKVILINLGQDDVLISRGMRIAQIVVAPVTQVLVREVLSVEPTERGAGGFGSTGV